MGIGTLVGAQVQDTTTTTGTGAITLAGSVPAGAPAGSTTFAAQFGTSAQTAPGNTFYAIIDGSGNIEVGLGTFNGSTTLTRDYILGSYTGGTISLASQTPPATHVNFAAGTKNVYSNASLFAQSVACWQRIPDDNAANIFSAIMSGTFTATVNAGSGTATGTVRYKVTNEGIVTLQLTAALTATANGTTLTITGIPAFLCNVATQVMQVLVVGTSTGGVVVPGTGSLASGASPTATGTLTLSQYTSLTTGYTATFTTAVVNGLAAQSFSYPLF